MKVCQNFPYLVLYSKVYNPLVNLTADSPLQYFLDPDDPDYCKCVPHNLETLFEKLAANDRGSVITLKYLRRKLGRMIA